MDGLAPFIFALIFIFDLFFFPSPPNLGDRDRSFQVKLWDIFRFVGEFL